MLFFPQYFLKKSKKNLYIFLKEEFRPFMIIAGILGFVLLFMLLGSIFLLKSYVSSAPLHNASLQQKLQATTSQLIALKNQDQFKRNQALQQTISAIQETYSKIGDLYESLVNLKLQTNNTQDFDTRFAAILHLLAQENYASASADITGLSNDINQQINQLAVKNGPATNAQNAPANNIPPASGYSRQTVTADTGTFAIDIIAADLHSTKVLIDTASNGDCGNNCPTLPLATYAQRSGAFAAINGTFFCPPEYPSCAGKTGSFDTLLMNKNKVYFNSANNVYSTVPLIYFTGNSVGIRTASSQWGRDTGVDSVIAMQPLLILSGQIVYTNSNDSKYTNKGTRDFIGNKGNIVYIGVIYNANMTDSAHVLHSLGMDNALNLDEGGSTALWMNGQYLAGPGRNIPNAVLFVRK